MHLKDFFPSSSLVVIFILISILSHIVAFPKYVRGIDFRYAACNSSVKCGKLGNIRYPFWVNGSQPNYCGHPFFGLNCLKDEAFLWFNSFRVLELDSRNQTLKIARFNDPSTGRIPCPYFNITENLITTFNRSSDITMIRVLHDCPPIKDLSSYGYPCNNQSHSYFVANESLANKFIRSCGYNFLLPVPRSAAEGLRNRSLGVGEALGKEYELKYWTPNDAHCEQCKESGGRCGYDWNFNTLSCFCRDKPHPRTCSPSKYP